MLPCGFGLLCEPVGKSAGVTGFTAGRVASMGAGIDPVNPVLPGGTEGVADGSATVFFSHALKASTAIATENINEYFMTIPFSHLMKTARRVAYLNRLVAIRLVQFESKPALNSRPAPFAGAHERSLASVAVNSN